MADDLDVLSEGEFDALLAGLAVPQVAEPYLATWTTGADLEPGRSRLMRPKEVMATIGISRRTLYSWIGSGKFPRPHAISTRVTGWPVGEVNDWLASKERTRKAG